MTFDTLNPALQQILVDIVMALIAAGLTALLVTTKQALRSLQANAGQNEYHLLQNLVGAGVRYAEQSGLASQVKLAGSEKKKLAIQFSSDLLAKYGLKVTPEHLSGIIEEVLYQELNWEKSTNEGPLPPLPQPTGQSPA
jgi:hypothetical protein